MPNLDIGKILSYGGLGLGFLLAFLAYVLLLSEQRKSPPRQEILISVTRFMVFAVIISLTAIASEYVKTQAASTCGTSYLKTKLIQANPVKTVLGDSDHSSREIQNISLIPFVTN